MLSGNQVVSKTDGNGANAVTPELQTFADWLLTQPNVIEVMAAVNAIVLEVDCTARNAQDGEMESEPEELDSGTWYLVRVSGMPAPSARGGLVSFVRQTAVVGNGQNGSGQTTLIPARVVGIEGQQ